MQVSKADWNKYIGRLEVLNKTAADKIRAYVEKYGVDDTKSLIDYSYAIVSKYAEGSAALAAQMYDEMAALEKKAVKAAEVADVASYGDVAKTINGVLKTSENPEEIAGAASRWVKMAGADTTLKNALRDRAEFAWIPEGNETCAFCIMLASNGWQPMSKKALKNGHAEHIHSNCNCQFAIRFSKYDNVAGYDPDKYKEMYASAEGRTSKDKINSMRRELYAENKRIVGDESGKADEFIPSIDKLVAINKNGQKIEFNFPDSGKERIRELRAEQESILTSLSQEYNTNLETVASGAQNAAGDVDMTGATMRLSSKYVSDAIHEFAHTLASSNAEKYGLQNNGDFWNEIRKVRTKYRAAVNADRSKMISSYADSQQIIDEFMAESFTQAKAREMGIPLPDKYGDDYEFSEKVLQIIDKYFKK